jgi:serine/threonine protein kinase
MQGADGHGQDGGGDGLDALLRRMAHAPDRSPEPAKLLHYLVLGKIGEGGMGAVYKAEDTKLGRVVALKRVASRASHDPNARARLRREARAASALNHPSIVTIFAIEEGEADDFIAMEYVEGEPLDAVVARGPMPVARVLVLGAEIADALEHAHAAGVIHRDIKPANVILSARGAKVLDFGIAKPASAPAGDGRALPATATPSELANTVTMEGAVLGTGPYMAPEQLRGEAIDGRADVFALGCLLYEAATGRRAFPGGVMTQSSTEYAPAPPSHHAPALPAELDAIILRALAKDREQRFATAGEMARSLRAIAQPARSPVHTTGYARSGDLHIGYQVVGDGPIDLVLVPPIVSHVECWWDEPEPARFVTRLASFSRLVLFDKRGTGVSDRVPPSQLPTLDERIDDVRAVMDAIGCGRAALLGLSEGAYLCVAFAARYPERTRAMALVGAAAAPLPSAAARAMHEAIDASWGRGSGSLGPHCAPSVARDPRLQAWCARVERLSTSPSVAKALVDLMTKCDVRPLLSDVRAPTLVAHRRGDLMVPLAAGRRLAERIAGARFVELGGDDHLAWFGDTDEMLDALQQHFTSVA